MSSGATVLSVFRLLSRAGGVLAVVLMLCTLAAPASAHSKHTPSSQLTTAVATTAQVPVSAASEMPSAPTAARGPHDHATGDAARHPHAIQSHRLHFEPDSRALAVLSQGSYNSHLSACICGGSCGSCTSLSCCAVALAPAAYAVRRVAHRSRAAITLSASLDGGSVAPLPRPPSFLLSV